MANNIFIDFLPPWIETGIQPAFYDKESGTVLQQTARMYAKVNEVVQSVNNQNETIADYIDKFNELHDYVHDYFDNLDVQQEINNKLDNMAEDGSLTELIKRYVDPIYEAYEASINETLTTTIENQNTRITGVEHEVASAVQGTPLVASSTAGMTETDRIYVNSTDGHWYYYDGDSWNDGGEYQAVAIADNSIDGDSLVTPLQKSVNYEVPIDITYTSGHYINKNGSDSTTNNSYLSSLISLKKGDTIIFTAKGYSTNVSLIASYLADGRYKPLVVSEGTATVTTTYTATYDGKFAISSIGEEPSDIMIYRKNITNIIDNVKVDYIQNTITDESDSSDWLSGYYIRYSNGETASNAKMRATDFIEFLPNTKMILVSKTNVLYNYTDQAGLAFYDADQNYISGIQYNDTDSSIALNPPQGAKYIRLSVTDVMANVGFTLAYADLNYTLNYLLNKDDGSDMVVNRTIGVTDNAVFIGDSLTYGQYYTASNTSYRNFYNYPYFLKKLMQINTITEIARGGATATSWWNNFSEQITQENSIYFVWLGTNSTFTDTIDTDCVGNDYTQYANTETGNMGKILQKINTLSGNKIILLNCYASGGHVDQTNEMINKFATRFNVSLVINLADTDIRNTKYHKAYNNYVNNVHLNDKGNNYVANIVNAQFNSWLGNNQFEMTKQHS